MKVLITGATGFLGEYLVKEFSQAGYQLVAFGRNKEKGQLLEVDSFIQGDFSDFKQIEAAAEGCEIVIHAGALSTVWGDWKDFESANVLGTENVLKACLKNEVRRLVFVSSPSIYTSKKDHLDISESFELQDKPLNYYIRSKIQAEALVKSYQSQLETVILRPRGLFGIGDNSIIPRLLAANSTRGIPLIRSGQNKVDITYVENVAQAALLSTTRAEAVGETFNITNGEPMSFKEILESLLKKIEIEPHYINLSLSKAYAAASLLEFIYKTLRLKGEPALTRYTAATLGTSQTLNIDKARAKLGYIPAVTIEEGLDIYANWWKENH
ncbi:MAG: NAD-dependent epimerase/dehydratase family protein [Streptococcaceae bacterium]|jgi:nucleoside-diphosphate-sugar epimerase|nr:NAD-dependent epimerase/dehydratase family protein [Streptococcaceae bacterium]